ncbi:sulfotransferase 1C4 isoform X1 [Schistocerca gregaria]|uniref:sulfotransferase 1C4 isoform X1 n=1 Tax=Schistocerca gregaria TaxID=7010 RepID=UPI00211E1AA1|nr:sulfotransferase 1C4 isoform X1 [Schistocerca gregaria]
MSTAFPLSIKYVSPDINKQLLEDFTGERTGFVQVGDDQWFFPSKYASEGVNFYNFSVRKDDTWVVTFPRSGTTWTQELVWLIANDLDYNTATKIPLVDRFPFLEFSVFVHDEVKKELLNQSEGDPVKQALIEKLSKPGYEVLSEMPSPRFIKTHFPFSLLPQNLLEEGCKVIYVARNPKDVAVSFYHLNRLFRTQGYRGDFKKYWDYFEKNLHPWTPYWTHVTEGWKRREHPNLLFLFYEEMNKDISETVERVAAFLGKSLTDEQVSELTSYLHINNFRKNTAVNMDQLKDIGLLQNGEQDFIRKGQNGSWTDEFTPELDERANEWIKENLKHTDLRFPVKLVEE